MSKQHHRTRIAADLASHTRAWRTRADQIETLARTVDDHLTRIDRERSAVGWPSTSDGARVSGGGSELTDVERAADRLWKLTNNTEQVRDAVRELEALDRRIVSHINTIARHARAAPAEVPACRDNQQGKHGATEWGDPLCPLPGVKSGLCSAHYMRWYRARKDAGLDTTRDFGGAA